MNFKTSEKIDKIAVALCEFQKEVGAVHKNAKNYQNTYANLEGTIETIQEPLGKHGLSITQAPGNDESGGLGITTMILHISGQYIRSFFSSRIVDKPDVGKNCQAHGSLISYYRRYALKAVLNLSDSDDDGLEARDTFHKSDTPPAPSPSKKEQSPEVRAAKASLIKEIRAKNLSEVDACKLMGIADYGILEKEERVLEIKGFQNLIKFSSKVKAV